MNRRHFIASALASSLVATQSESQEREMTVLDVNFSIGEWPGRGVPTVDADGLRRRGITTAITGSLDAMLHRDISAVNERLSAICDTSGGVLIPAGAVNPQLPGWREDLRHCAEKCRMKVIRLLPCCHGYTLESPVFVEFLDASAEMNLSVQIVAQIEDARTQHPLWRVPAIDLKPLTEVLKGHAQSRVMILNANSAMITAQLRGCESVWIDCAMIEGVGGLENTLKSWPAEKLCLGTYAPFFYPEAALLKKQESGLEDQVEARFMHLNAESFLS